MTVIEKQNKFAGMVAQLIQYIQQNGYWVTLGDAYAKSGHSHNSLHYIRLAIDINLFKNKVYLKNTADYKQIGEYWESIGGSWGGRFNDGNHFSLEHEGKK